MGITPSTLPTSAATSCHLLQLQISSLRSALHFRALRLFSCFRRSQPHDKSPNEVSPATFIACFLYPAISGETGHSCSHKCEITFVPLAPHAADRSCTAFILSLRTCILPTKKEVNGVGE